MIELVQKKGKFKNYLIQLIFLTFSSKEKALLNYGVDHNRQVIGRETLVKPVGQGCI